MINNKGKQTYLQNREKNEGGKEGMRNRGTVGRERKRERGEG